MGSAGEEILLEEGSQSASTNEGAGDESVTDVQPVSKDESTPSDASPDSLDDQDIVDEPTNAESNEDENPSGKIFNDNKTITSNDEAI